MNLLILMIMTSLQTTTLTVSSPAFKHENFIPVKYTCEGENINPTISVSGFPKTTKSLAIIMDDPDAPNDTFDHWLIWNIPPIQLINEDSSPGTEGKNGSGKTGYKGPCPPSGVHRYFFKIYALDTKLTLKSGADRKMLEDAMKEHIIISGELIGLYKKLR